MRPAVLVPLVRSAFLTLAAHEACIDATGHDRFYNSKEAVGGRPLGPRILFLVFVSVPLRVSLS